jgi:hypothetical protein
MFGSQGEGLQLITRPEELPPEELVGRVYYLQRYAPGQRPAAPVDVGDPAVALADHPGDRPAGADEDAVILPEELPPEELVGRVYYLQRYVARRDGAWQDYRVFGWTLVIQPSPSRIIPATARPAQTKTR